MKKSILVIALTLVVTGITMIAASVVTAQTSNEFAVPLTDPGKRGKLKASLNYGSITVKGTARKDILVRYTVKADDDNRDASKNGLKRIGGGSVDLEVVENENTVKVHSDSWNNKINLEIEIPSGMDLDIKTYNDGDLYISNIQGNLDLKNYNGEITALNISGSVIATTYNGGIKISFDKVTDGTPMSYSTYNGDIDVTVPPGLKASFKMKTEQGDIYSDLDVDFKSGGPVQKADQKGAVYKVIVDDWKKGNVNGGGSEITIKNYNGDIFLRKKAG
ncbi:MAG: DUF4097 family beta strand repeat-containing protein [Chryseolinea sp.]